MVVKTDKLTVEDLRGLVKNLSLGVTITLVDTNDQPLVLLVGLNPPATTSHSLSDWRERWEILAEKVGRAWKSDETALEILNGMRR